MNNIQFTQGANKLGVLADEDGSSSDSSIPSEGEEDLFSDHIRKRKVEVIEVETTMYRLLRLHGKMKQSLLEEEVSNKRKSVQITKGRGRSKGRGRGRPKG